MVLLIVYVGAVAVLFLFVVMMLDINISLFREKFLDYLPLGLFVGFVILFELFLVVNNANFNNDENLINKKEFTTNTHELGNVLYTDFFLLFQLAGIILLIAMVGSILLTLRKREGVKKQSIYKQIFRE